MAAEAIIGRCLDALEMLALAPRGLPLTVLSQRLGLVKSATHRLLAELQSEGFVTQEPESQHYRLTMRFPTLGFRFLTGLGVVEAGKQPLDALAARTGELVRMTVAEADRLTWIARAQGATTALRFDPETGPEVPLVTTASARVWLATLPESRALALVKAEGFGADARDDHSGPNAPRSLSDFAVRLRATRRDGHAIAIDEIEPGMSAVAVVIAHPVPGRPVLGTVSVAGPSLRVDRARLESFVPDLRATAAELSTRWPPQALGMPGDLPDVASVTSGRKPPQRQSD